MMNYDELVKELFDNGIIELEGKQYKIEAIESPASPCTGCPILSESNQKACDLCIAYDFYVFVDHNQKERFRLKEVKK